VPKTKDLVNTSKQKYKDMYDVILSGGDGGGGISSTNNHNNSTSIYNLEDILPPVGNINNNSDLNMKNELKNFIKSQMNNNGQFQNDNITTLENIPNQNNYSFIE
jgi:prenyltransferase beta subunit